MKLGKAYMIILAGVLMLACSKLDLDRIGFTQVITIGAIEIESNSAFLIGDIEDIRESGIVESGFLLSSTIADDANLMLGQADVEQIIAPSLDTISEDRAFATRASDLLSGTTYFFRAYVLILGENIPAYGMIDSFSTLQVDLFLESIERSGGPGCPTEANIQLRLQLSGIEASDLQFGIVWRNDVLAEPTLSDMVEFGDHVDNDGVAVINLSINDCVGVYSVRAFLQTSGNEPVFSQEMEFTPKEGGVWFELGAVPFEGGGGGFGTDRYGYLFSDKIVGTIQSTSFWSFDPNTLMWQLKDDPPFIGGRSPLSTNDRILSLNNREPFEFLKDNEKWEEIVSLQIVLHTIEYGGGGFSFDNKLFLDSEVGGWYSYNFTTNETKPIDDFPGEGGEVQFLVGNKGYLGMGDSEAFDVGGPPPELFTDFWEFDFRLEKWAQISDIPEVFRTSGVGFSMNGKGYVLTGYYENDVAYSGFWEYNPDTDEWTRLTDFGRGDGNASVGFVIDGIAYGGLGENMQGELRQEFWKYVPELD